MTHRNHHEREFEAFLAGEESELARLYRRLPQSEPDAKLDAAVLSLARAAVEPQRVNALRHANVRQRRPLWLVGLSSAAGVVLAAGIAWQMRNGFNESAAPTLRQSASARTERDVIPISAIVPPAEPAAAPPAPPPPIVAPATASTTATVPAPPPAKPMPMRSKAAPHGREAELAAAVDAKKDSSLRADVAVPADTSLPERVAATTAQASAEPLAREGLADAESSGGGGVDKFTADAAQPQPFPGTGGVPDYNSVERKAAIASGSRRDDYGVDVDAASADPLAKQEQRARVARAAKEKRPAEEISARAQSAPEAERQIAPQMAAAPAVAASPATSAAQAPPMIATEAAPRPAAAGAIGNAASAELQRNAMLPPDEWIRRIRDLLREERRADALENLELLRRKHPAYVVPADLRELR